MRPLLAFFLQACGLALATVVVLTNTLAKNNATLYDGTSDNLFVPP